MKLFLVLNAYLTTNKHHSTRKERRLKNTTRRERKEKIIRKIDYNQK